MGALVALAVPVVLLLGGPDLLVWSGCDKGSPFLGVIAARGADRGDSTTRGIVGWLCPADSGREAMLGMVASCPCRLSAPVE